MSSFTSEGVNTCAKNTQGAFYSEAKRLMLVAGGFKLASAAKNTRKAVVERTLSRAVKI